MSKAFGKLVGLHQAFWTYDPWYRRAWFTGPQVLSLTALVFLLASTEAPPPAAPWVKPLPPAPPGRRGWQGARRRRRRARTISSA